MTVLKIAEKWKLAWIFYLFSFCFDVRARQGEPASAVRRLNIIIENVIHRLPDPFSATYMSAFACRMSGMSFSQITIFMWVYITSQSKVSSFSERILSKFSHDAIFYYISSTVRYRDCNQLYNPDEPLIIQTNCESDFMYHGVDI